MKILIRLEQKGLIIPIDKTVEVHNGVYECPLCHDPKGIIPFIDNPEMEYYSMQCPKCLRHFRLLMRLSN